MDPGQVMEGTARPKNLAGQRKSTPRIEKGTLKVDEIELKQEASTLLYALMAILDTTEQPSAKYPHEGLQKRIQDLVGSFGLNVDRIKEAGAKKAHEMLVHAENYHLLEDVKADAAKAMQLIKSLQKDAAAGLGLEIDDDENPTHESGIDGSLRGTRQGSLKRKREEEELVRVTSDMAGKVDGLMGPRAGSGSELAEGTGVGRGQREDRRHSMV